MNTDVSKAIEQAACLLGSQEAIGALFGLQKAAVSHWKRIGSVPVEYCRRIEIATDGAVTRKQLRPNDWQEIWPELSEAA